MFVMVKQRIKFIALKCLENTTIEGHELGVSGKCWSLFLFNYLNLVL